MDKKELVLRARALERLLARRRRAMKQLADLDVEVRMAKKLLRDLTEPDSTEPYQPSNDRTWPD